MLVSLKAIKKYVDLSDLTPEEIAKGMTFAGLEVEEISYLAKGNNLIIGHVEECENHPDSDHLHVLQVNLGEKYGVQQIVCGAPNARKGLNVIVARPGAVLAEKEIKASTIRGVASNGMCCSLNELGVDSKYLRQEQLDGIEELPLDAPIGEENVLEYLGLDDVIFNFNVLANRPDLLSIYNFAKEFGTVFSRKVNIPEATCKADFKTKLVVGSKTPKCSQFSGREVKNIVTKPSPKWMSDFLMAEGVRSINNIVDIGNYVMLMTGQPLHMYDADKLSKAELYAQDDYEGDFVALDEKTYKVNKGDIVICTENKPMCLGGVMGSLACAVDENTKNIFIEAASFDSATIRRTSNRLGLSSESSQRFVKGTNHFQSEFVLDFTANLIKELCEAKEISNIFVYQSEQKKEIVIPSSLERINGRLGTEFTYEQVKEVLERAHFKINDKGNNKFEAIVPEYRLDCNCDADLSEEVIRILGFENVKNILPVLATRVGSLTLRQQRLKQIREFLLDSGIDECLTYSLVSEANSKKFNLLNKEEHYAVLHPLTEDRKYLRTHILYSLLETANYNVSRQNKNLKLFETSNMISASSRSEHLAIVLLGNEYYQGAMKKIPFDFYSLKGIVEGIFQTLGIEKSRFKFEKSNDNLEWLHPGKSADVVFQNHKIGQLGEVHPTAKEELGLAKMPIVVLELNLEPLLDAKVSINRMTPISKFPSVQRDLAFVLDKDIPARDVITAIKKIGKGLVSEAEVFDVYEGEHVASGKKSMAITITYTNPDATLKEKEVSDMENAIKFELTKKFKAELRG